MELTKYSDVFTIDDGNPFVAIFGHIPEISKQNYDRLFIDALYINMYLNYGDRYIAPIVERFLKLDPNKITIIEAMGELFGLQYSNTLDHLYKAMFADYNPIENYSAIETGTDTRQLSDKTIDSINKTTSDNSTTDIDINSDNTVNTELKKSGYNVAEPVVDTIQNTTENNTSSNTETVERSGEETHAGQSDKTVAETTTHNLQRSGNIGVTTSQQMIESEIKLRENDFWDIFIKKFVDLYTLSIY